MSISNIQEVETIQTYNKYAASWVDEHADRRVLKVTVSKFKKFLSSGAILEIGSGGGSDAELLVAAGYRYFGTDASAGMVEAARAKHANLQFEQLSVYDLADLHRQFDGFWASAVLLHIPKQRIDEALQAISTVIRLGGVGFISMKDGEKEEFEKREKAGRHENRLFAYWRKDEFEKALKHNGFTVVDYTYESVNERTNWHKFIVRKGKETWKTIHRLAQKS